MNDIKNIKPSQTTKPGMGYTHCCAPVPCYNCGSIEKDFYLIVKNERGQWLYEDVCCDIEPDDEIYEFEICGSCGAAL